MIEDGGARQRGDTSFPNSNARTTPSPTAGEPRPTNVRDWLAPMATRMPQHPSSPADRGPCRPHPPAVSRCQPHSPRRWWIWTDPGSRTHTALDVYFPRCFLRVAHTISKTAFVVTRKCVYLQVGGKMYANVCEECNVGRPKRGSWGEHPLGGTQILA